MSLKAISTADLQAELVRREQSSQALLRKREKLVEQLREIDAELELLGAPAVAAPPARAARKARGGPRGPRGPRARNTISLADALAAAIEVRAVVTPSEAAGLVLQNGYQSTARNFAMMVSNVLAKDPRFQRLERGRYERVE